MELIRFKFIGILSKTVYHQFLNYINNYYENIKLK